MNKHMKSPSASFSSLMLLLFLFLVLGFFPISQSTPSVRNVSYSDEQALLEFKAALTSHPLADWTRNTSFCIWRGITCSPPPMQVRVVGLRLSSMGLEGIISPVLGNLSALQSLDLSYNALRGHIPVQLGQLFNAKVLRLSDNQLEGNIPASLGRCSSLLQLALAYNRLQGIFPPELGFLPHLEMLYLRKNHLTGRIPSSIGNLSSLVKLDLSANSLTDTIPDNIGTLTKLQSLSLFENQLSGTIPCSITNLTSLMELDLYANSLRGIIPDEIGMLTKLKYLDLYTNELSGTIPSSIGNLSSLINLDLSMNNIRGTIPWEELCNKSNNLEWLLLRKNMLTGKILNSIRNCTNLKQLSLSGNKIGGQIPPEITNLTNLTLLGLSDNLLGGHIPEEIGKMQSLQSLDASHNKLSGEIPSELVNCIALRTLYLSHNIFQGPIPGALSQLTNLEYIDLSFNNLTGYVEEQIFNKENFVVFRIRGNPGLCGSGKYLLPTCAKEGQGQESALRNKIGVAVGVIAFILFSSILALIWRWKFSREQTDISDFMFNKIRHPKFLYQDIVNATNAFDEENLLGTGNFGTVFKGTLEDGRVVAIKVLHIQTKEGKSSFKKECRVLGRIRHRNVIRVISACSYLNFKALVLEFACNGSLEKYLYPERDEEDVCRLGLSECLNIAIDVAHGMEYLHYDCFTQIVHCDLKPSNVLLDANMTALVSDFGVSRITNFADLMDSLSTTCAMRGTIGYIAPEYGLGERISIKGDVYSYGILLLEMVTRKRPTDTMFAGDFNLRSWVRSAFPNNLADVVDNQLLRNLTMEQHRCLISFIHVGLLCSHDSPQYRPSTRDVGNALESLKATFIGCATVSSYLRTSILDLLSVPSTNHAPEEKISDSQSSTY